MDDSKKKDDKVVRVDIRTLPKGKGKMPSFVVILMFSVILSLGIYIFRAFSFTEKRYL
jgi:hypothetical protein